MPRVKRGNKRVERRKKILKLAKGYRLTKSKLHRSAKELVASGEAARVSDEAVAQIITAAVRLYYAKSELEDRPLPAIVQEGAETLTPTEMLVAVSEMLRDVRLGPMELGLWFRRRPGENLPDQSNSDQTGNATRVKP